MKVFLTAFLYFQFSFVIFCHKNIITKALLKYWWNRPMTSVKKHNPVCKTYFLRENKIALDLERFFYSQWNYKYLLSCSFCFQSLAADSTSQLQFV